MLHAEHLSPPAAKAPPDWPAQLRALAGTARDTRLRRYYAAGCPAGTTPIAQVPLVALDVETTGLDPVRDGIVSIGLVPFTLERIRASQARHWLVKPRVDLAEASVALHGITHSALAGAPDLDAVLEDLLALLAGQVVVVHCAAVERGFLNGALQRRIGEDIHFPVIDTMDLEARALTATPRPWRQRLLQRQPPRPSLRLAACRERHGLPRYGLHHALGDALATAELLLAQLAHTHTHTPNADADADTPLQALWS